MKSSKALLFFTILAIAFSQSACGWIGDSFSSFSAVVGLNETATVIASRTYIRSSYAVVAADLLEVKRGETLDIFDEMIYEKVHWYRVRARDEEATEGWIEAQNVIVGKLLEKSRALAEEDKNSQPQAKGQLRASTKLRLAPEIRDDNVILKLDKKGDTETSFDVISWKFVQKAQEEPAEAANTIVNAPRRPRTRNEEIEAAKQEQKPEELDDKYDIWYKVRLDPSVSPAPSGWIFGRQVELQVPTDILYYQIGQKKFVTWQRLDTIDPVEKVRDADKPARPGSWVILSRSDFVKAKDNGEEPDFDGILVLYYDKYSEEHTTIYRSGEVWGKLPLRLDGTGDNKAFTVLLRNAAGEFEEKRFAVFKNARGSLQVTPPEGIPKVER